MLLRICSLQHTASRIFRLQFDLRHIIIFILTLDSHALEHSITCYSNVFYSILFCFSFYSIPCYIVIHYILQTLINCCVPLYRGPILNDIAYNTAGTRSYTYYGSNSQNSPHSSHYISIFRSHSK